MPDVRHYPDLIQAISSAQDGSIIPKVFRDWAAVSAVAGALGRRTWYDFGAFRVHPNLYVALVAEPGRGKSSALGLAYDSIFKKLSESPGLPLEKRTMRYQEYGANEPLYLIQDRITPERLSQDMKRCHRTDPDLSTIDRPYDESPITLVTSEFGAFMNRNDNYLQMFMTDMWDSKSEYSYRTKTAGTDLIKGPCLNWCVCATPTQLVENLPANARSQGLLSRIIIVYYEGSELKRSLNYGKVPNELIDELTKDLARISNLKGEFKFADTRTYEYVDSWIGSGMQPIQSDPNMAEYNERRLSHLIKLCMVVSAARSDTLLITRSDFDTALNMLLSVEAQMPKALTKFGLSEIGQSVIDLQGLVAACHDGMPLTKLTMEVLKKVRSSSEVQSVISNMVEAGLIKVRNNRVYVEKPQ